jgi:uncharacterized radical SAM superfamily Fe-S cluster-containing enzyme
MTGKHVIMNHFFYVTSRCNLKCPVCYEGKEALEEPTLDDLRRVLPTLRHARVLLCGAEPTSGRTCRSSSGPSTSGIRRSS